MGPLGVFAVYTRTTQSHKCRLISFVGCAVHATANAGSSHKTKKLSLGRFASSHVLSERISGGLPGG